MLLFRLQGTRNIIVLKRGQQKKKKKNKELNSTIRISTLAKPNGNCMTEKLNTIKAITRNGHSSAIEQSGH